MLIITTNLCEVLMVFFLSLLITLAAIELHFSFTIKFQGIKTERYSSERFLVILYLVCFENGI